MITNKDILVTEKLMGREVTVIAAFATAHEIIVDRHYASAGELDEIRWHATEVVIRRIYGDVREQARRVAIAIRQTLPRTDMSGADIDAIIQLLSPLIHAGEDQPTQPTIKDISHEQ
jgi:hypothetical protein